jgi:molecular chaperone GrpE
MNRENIKKDDTIKEETKSGEEADKVNQDEIKEQNNGCEEKGAEESSNQCGTEQEEEVIKLTKENETLKDLLQRRQADFENYKKRTAKLQEDYKKTAIREFARDIININDDLIRAIEAGENLTGADAEEAQRSFHQGVLMISRRIIDTLGNYGIVEIDALNMPFDPNLHEAIEIEESEQNIETDTVTKVHQKGFKLDDQVIRTAKVKVAKAVKNRGEAPDGSENAESSL